MPELLSPHVPTFYQMKDFVASSNRAVPRQLNHDYLHFSERSRAAFNAIMQYFNEVNFERVGVLSGEYVLYSKAVLICRDGTSIKINTAWEDPSASRLLDDFCNSPDFAASKKTALEMWDDFPLLEDAAIISHPYADNYFHWTLETITKIRFFSGTKENKIIVRAADLLRRFQKDLLVRAMGDSVMFIQKDQHPFRVRNPKLGYELMSEDGIHWLRKAVNISTSAGKRRIYLRRSTTGARSGSGGGVSETPEFLAFLKEYAFEIVDFADKEWAIEEQVKMLDKAAVILAPHGAAMTNLAYLNPALSVIEIMGFKTARAVFMHISSLLKFHYYGIHSTSYDAQNNVIVDMEELRGAMQSCIADQK